MSSSKYPLLAIVSRRCLRWLLAMSSIVGSASASVVGPTGVSLQNTNSSVGGYAASSSIALQSSSPRVVRFNFTGLFLYGGQFVNLSSLASGPAALGGALQSVSINATLTNPEPADLVTGDQTWASDLTILVATSSAGDPNTNNGSTPINLLLQVGGTSGFESGVTAPATYVERSLWYPLGDPNESTVANTIYGLSSSITLASTPGLLDPSVWVGHGFTTSANANYGTWSGYVDFTFASSGGSGVPDASRTALLLAPGTLLLLGLAGRSRRRG